MRRPSELNRLTPGRRRVIAGMISGMALLVSQPASAQPRVPLACEEFYDALAAAPHVSLTRSSGPFTSIWDGATREGCEVDFETNDSLGGGQGVPDFSAHAGTEMYDAGWRMSHGIGADGAGSGTHGIERGPVACIIRWARPADIDDAGAFVESDTLRRWVKCWGRKVEQGPRLFEF